MKTLPANSKRVSIILPVFNEEHSIPLFRDVAVPILEAIEDVLFEFVIVDDGSNDATRAVAIEWCGQDDRVCLISFSRNFGKEAALTAGLKRATGDAVIPMDIDMQDPPEVVQKLVEKWHEGYGTVLAIREMRETDTFSKRTAARLFYDVFNALSNDKIVKDAGDFRLLDRKVVDAVLELPERNRFMKGVLSWVGFSVAAVKYTRPSRAVGLSKFNSRKLFSFAIDGITSFSTLPLRIWSVVGILVAVTAVLYAIKVFIAAIVWGDPVAGYPSLMIILLFSIALNMITAGITGEYLGRISDEVKKRPLYIEEIYLPARHGSSSPEREVLHDQ